MSLKKNLNIPVDFYFSGFKNPIQFKSSEFILDFIRHLISKSGESIAIVKKVIQIIL